MRTQIDEDGAGHKASARSLGVVNVDALTLELRITLEGTRLEARTRSAARSQNKQQRTQAKGVLSHNFPRSFVPHRDRAPGKYIAKTFDRSGYYTTRTTTGQHTHAQHAKTRNEGSALKAKQIA